MTTPDTAIDLDELIDAQVASISGAFPDVEVTAYDEERREFAMPACMLRVADFERDADGDIGTEQLVMLARFEAHVIVGFRAPAARTAAPKLALAIAHHIEGNRFGQPVSPAQVSVVEPDEFVPEMDRFVVWRVDWQQVVHVGASIWDNDGTLPTRVLASWAPDVGIPNEGRYQDVLEVEP